MPPRVPQHSNQYHSTRHTYIPEHAQRLMARRMEQSVPASMQKYVEPYLQQNVVQPALGGQTLSPQPSAQNFNPRPAVRPAFQQPGQAVTPTIVNPAVSGAAASQPLPPQPQTQPAAPQPAAAPAEPYDFIMNADQTPLRRSLPMPRLDSTLKRAVFTVGSLVVLLILFIVIKGLFTSTPDLTLFVGIAQDQQAIIHLTSPNGSSQPVLDPTTQNFVATANASLTSSQSAIVTYLAKNHRKAATKVLGLKVSSQLDTQLTNAQAAGTYEQTFQQIMKTELTGYMGDLSQTYNKTTGPKGRALLTSDYNQAKLLLTQLGNGQ